MIFGTVTAPNPYAKKTVRWGSIAFFALFTVATFAGIPLYVAQAGWRSSDLTLFFVYSFLTTLAITAGYHRHYAHRAYRVHPFIEFLILFFGSAAVQQSALKWAALHRQHHNYTDTERDPYNITKGFFHAHMGWLWFWKYAVDYDSVRDLKASALARHQHAHFQSWVVVSALILPVLIGAACGSWLGGFLFGVAARLTVVFQSTFFINSVAHSFGTS